MKLTYSAIMHMKGKYLVNSDNKVVLVKKVTTKKITFTDCTKLDTITFFQSGQNDYRLANDYDIGMYQASLENQSVDNARELLRANGYYVDNLWSVYDVKGLFDCTDEQAQEVLGKSMTNDATIEQIWFSIKSFGSKEGLTEIENVE